MTRPISRRTALAAATAFILAPHVRAAGDSLRERPLHVIVPFAVGSPGDRVLRALAPRWQALTGQPLLVEHRPGASGALGAQAVLQAAPDGHTLLFATSDVLVNNTALFRTLRYDPVRDFRPLARIGPVPLVLCVPATLPVDDLAGFAAWARGRQTSYGSWGEGSHAHLVGEMLLARRLGLATVHAPYRGLGPMLQDLAGGHVAAGIGVPPAVAPLVEAGRLRALAVTGGQRSIALPDVPTLQELGHREPVFGLRQWAALMAPAAVPAALAQRLESGILEGFAHEESRRVLKLAGFESERAGGADDVRAALAQDMALVPGLIRALGVQPQ